MKPLRLIRTPLEFLLFFSLAALPLTSAAAQESSRERRVDEIFAAHDTPDSAGCAVSIMERGAIVYKRGYGMANLEYGIPITPSSIFHVASVSKQFTAFAVALLVADGKVSWSDDIREYVPEVPDHGETITLEDLVHHISGIRDQWNLLSMAGWRWEADVVRQEDVLDLISRQKALNFAPGRSYLYSNTGFTLLAVVVERVSDMTLAEFTEERIFKPLGMNDTHFHDDHQLIVPNRAYAYAPDTTSEYGLRISIPDFAIVGASSLFTTVEDMAKWDRNFYTGQVGGQEILEQMLVKGVLDNGEEINYAFGLSHGTYKGLPTVGHGGADAGYRSQFIRYPEQEFSVAVLCNFPSSNPGRRARLVADIYLADQFEEAEEDSEEESEAAKFSEAELEALSGVFVHEAADRSVSIKRRDDALYAVGSGGAGGLALQALGGERFRVQNQVVRYEIGSDGDVSLFATAPGGAWEYRKVESADTSAEALQQYVGEYFSSELLAGYSVKLEDGKLILWNRKHGDMDLEPQYKDGFDITGAGNMTFTRDANGRVDGFTMSSGRVWKVRCDKVN